MVAIHPTKHLTDIHEWHLMGAAGVFSENNHVELIDGEIIEKAQVSPNHAGHLKRLTNQFYKLLFGQVIISVQDPVQLSTFSEPEPDLMLLKPNADFYSSRHPNTDDVLLLIEVSDSTLDYDQNTKLRLYARHNIHEYWILNLIDNCLEVYRKPRGESYEEKMTLRTGDNVTLTQHSDISLSVSTIL